jgi:hypothetical protein
MPTATTIHSSGEKELQHTGETVKHELHGILTTVTEAPTYAYVIAALTIAILVAAYVLVAKGRGSHAGREQVRRAYRRELAKQMAKEDAARIREGKKTRRRWMQW